MYAGSNGLRSIKTAITEVLGIENNSLEGLSLHGRTFLNIIKQVCDRENRSFPDQAELENFFKKFAQEYSSNNPGDGYLLPGVAKLVSFLHDNSRCLIGIVTGNPRSGSDLKLKRYGLEKYFSFGAYGDEFFERPEMVQDAVLKAEKHASCKFEKENIFVVGDTTADVLSAVVNSYKAIGVATGKESFEKLQQAGADLVLKDLSDINKFKNYLKL